MDDNRLRALVRTMIAAAFEQHESVWSGDIHQQLIDAGHEVPADALTEILEELRKQGYVRLTRPRASQSEFHQHGAVGITPGARYREI
ncbi:MAG: hypothetical protein M3220_08385 [Chloroflexota bacterium]|nr:hypothetical protein [Chloroflexota bacterium]